MQLLSYDSIFLFGHLYYNWPIFDTPVQFVSLLEIKLVHDICRDCCPKRITLRGGWMKDGFVMPWIFSHCYSLFRKDENLNLFEELGIQYELNCWSTSSCEGFCKRSDRTKAIPLTHSYFFLGYIFIRVDTDLRQSCSCSSGLEGAGRFSYLPSF